MVLSKLKIFVYDDVFLKMLEFY